MAGRDGARPLLYKKSIVRLNFKDNINKNKRGRGFAPRTPVPRQDIRRGRSPGHRGEQRS